MPIAPETTTIIFVVLAAFGILFWGFQRSRIYGRLGLLAWLQSIVLMSPWLIFFSLFALGIYLNLIGIVLLILISSGVYIWLGRKLRAAGQEEMLRDRAAQRLKMEAKSEKLPIESNINNNNGKNQPNIPNPVLPIPTEELAQIKTIFGLDSFFVTETIPYQEGAVFKGNMRVEPETAYSVLSTKLETTLGDKYRLFLVEGTEEKPVVIVLPRSNDPKPSTLAQKNLALVLLVATIVTTLEASSILLGFDLFSDLGRFREAIPISLGLWSILAAHEIGHYFMAKKYNVRLSPPFFLPTWQIGSFGAITRFESVLPNRNALFDISLAGSALGGIVSLVMLVVGMLLSHTGSQFQLPTQFFQASILVGSLAKAVLDDRLQQTIVDVHPFLIIGWLGLIISALNLMPAGQLDGGRIVQSIYGRQTARRTTIATVILLGIVTLFGPGNPIPLYWAILILFLQRDAERPSLNELTEPDDTRAALGLLALFLMLATLIPLSSGLAGRLGIGG
jgi:membrane-associated protease RseP (regulator of RpoE activity)